MVFISENKPDEYVNTLIDEAKKEAEVNSSKSEEKWLFRFGCVDPKQFALYRELFEDIASHSHLSGEVSYMGLFDVRGDGVDLNKSIAFIFGEDEQLYSDIWSEKYTYIVDIGVLFNDKKKFNLEIFDELFLINKKTLDDKVNIRVKFRLFISYLLYTTGALEMLNI